jgi:hypothetical protein
VLGHARLVDALRNLPVGLARVVKQLCQTQVDGCVIVEQQLFEHRLVNRDHLFQISSGEIHDAARNFAGSMTACERFPSP